MEPVVYQSVLSCSFLCLCGVDLRMEQEGHGRDIEYVFFFLFISLIHVISQVGEND